MTRGFFVNRRQKSLYYALQAGSDQPGQIWIFCNALLEEATFAQRTMTELADAIAGQGHLAMRFDYEGQGDSEGSTAAVCTQDWIDDIVAAVAFARQRGGQLASVNLLALRGGALLAAAAADAVGAKRLLLIEPVLDGGKYFEECLRAHMTTQLACFNKVNEPRAVLRERLHQGGQVSVLGHEVGHALSASLGELQLPSLLEAVRADVDLIHVPRHAARPVLPALAGLAAPPRITLHPTTAPVFWDSLGRYWELSDELRSAVLGLIPGCGEAPACGAGL